MLKIFVRVKSVTAELYNGRDYKPTAETVGRFVRITNMETWGDTFQIFHGIVVDANAEDVDGGEIVLMDTDIEAQDGIPVLFTEMLDDVLANPGKAKCSRCGQALDVHTLREDQALDCPTGGTTYFSSKR